MVLDDFPQRKGPSGPVNTNTGGSTTSEITNLSDVPGTTATDALNYLQASSAKFATGTDLTNADQTLATSQRYVMPAGTTTAPRTKTLTPNATAARAFQLEIGTQGHNVTIQNGGPGGTSGQGTFVVLAGQKMAVFFVSDGTDVSVTAAMPLAEEPVA